MNNFYSPSAVLTNSWSSLIPFEKAIEFVSDDTDFGVYQIYGCQPDGIGDELLYIGRVKGGSFGWRIPQHKGWLDKNNIKNIFVRLGRLCGAITPSDEIWNNEITLAEALLIFAHKPPLNVRVGLGVLEAAAQNVIVLNMGERGEILPEVSGLRWANAENAPALTVYSTKSRNN